MFSAKPPVAAGELDPVQRIFFAAEPAINRLRLDSILLRHVVDSKDAFRLRLASLFSHVTPRR